MDKIIIGVDDREQSRDALRLGAELGKRLDARLIAATAIRHSPLPIETAETDRARREQFDRIFEKAEIVLGELEHDRYELDDSAARGLYRLAESRGADLIVVGSTHRGELGRVYPGSVGEKLLQSAPCAVAVAPHGYADRDHPGFALIGVAYDGELDSRFALAEAEQLAADIDAELRVITVVPAYVGLDPRPTPAAQEAMYSERLSQGVTSVTMVHAERFLDRGEPSKVLARHGVDLDLLVVGSRGYGPVRRTLLGSVGSEVIRTAPCPVLVMPRAAHRAGSEARPGAVAESGASGS